jgi:hypothetical protein
MPESHSSDITYSQDHTIEHRPLQEVFDHSCGSGGLNASQASVLQQAAKRSSSEQLRWSLVRTTNALSLILTMGPLIAGTIAFCITRNPWSFIALLPVLSQVSNLRRRLEESAFPISQEDLLIRLKELEVEVKRIEKQSTVASLPLFIWIRRRISKSRK